MSPGRWPSRNPLASGRTLPEVWQGLWAARPGSPVLVDGWRSERAVDGAGLDRRTALMAAVLASHGVGPGDRVLWRARATLESVEALLAVLRAGAVLVPVSPSARFPEVAHVVGDAGPVLAQEKVPVVAGDTVETLHERIKACERRLYPATVKRMVEELGTAGAARARGETGR